MHRKSNALEVYNLLSALCCAGTHSLTALSVQHAKRRCWVLLMPRESYRPSFPLPRHVTPRGKICNRATQVITYRYKGTRPLPVFTTTSHVVHGPCSLSLGTNVPVRALLVALRCSKRVILPRDTGISPERCLFVRFRPVTLSYSSTETQLLQSNGSDCWSHWLP